MRRIVRVGICVIAVGAIVAISVAGAGSKTLRASPVAARTPATPRLGPLAHSGVSCPIATSSSSACSATPCTVYIQSAVAQTALLSSRGPPTLRGRLHALTRQLAVGKIASRPLVRKRIVTAPAVTGAPAPGASCTAKAQALPRAIPISVP